MKVSRYIQMLEDLMKEHGDLEVDTYFFANRAEARIPVIGYRKIFEGRESKSSFWQDWNGEDRKGEKVIKV